MTQPIDRARVHHIAKLASLSLSDDEADKLAVELDAIVRYVGELDALDTEDVPATLVIHEAPAAWRDDVLLPGLSRDDALAMAPKVEHDGFAVPTFVE